MLNPTFDIDQILAPIGLERFRAEYDGKKPLHIKGTPDKFAEVMTWSKLNDILGQATIWSQNSLNLVLDKETIQPPRFCSTAAGRDGGTVMRPEPEKVKEYLRRGATLVANDIDHLSAGLTSFSHAMEQGLSGMVQGNLYLSSRRRPGFAAHFDSHDVFAVHVEGTKTWHIYEGRVMDPIAHPVFKSYGRDHHEKAKGKLLMDVQMEPGDLLYLPRGQYHDAIADEGGAVHIAFGVTYTIGLDIVSMLYERMIYEQEFRANLPPLEAGEEALVERLRQLSEGIAKVMVEPKTIEQVQKLQRSQNYPRNAYNLPELLAEQADERYRVRASGIRLVQQGGRFGLVSEGSRAATEVPAHASAMVAWVLERKQFSRSELAGAFPEQKAQQDQLLKDLGAMRLTEPIA
ncbi:MAG: cupin domain-containing protein [Pseudomonadota bacterium]